MKDSDGCLFCKIVDRSVPSKIVFESPTVLGFEDIKPRAPTHVLFVPCRHIDGVTDVLDALRGRYVMGIVTSSRRDHFDVIHRTTGLLEYFDFVLTSDDFTHVKPHPEPYLKAIEKSGVSREACLAIEDSERGLTAAKAAGIGCIVVPTALTRASVFAQADRVLGSITEILSVL